MKDLCRPSTVSPRWDRKSTAQKGNSLCQLKILLNWKWKAGKKCIEIHLILWLVISFFLYIYICLSHGTIDFAYLISSNISPSYLISGHRWTIIVNIFCPEPHFSHHSSQSLPKSPNSIPPFLLVSSQNTVAAEAILTYFCTITPSGCPSTAPFFFFYFVSHRQPASLCRCSEVCEEETLMGEVSVPLCLNAWEVTYLGAEKERERERERRRDGGGAVEYQFCSSLLGQKHLLYRKGKKVINKRGMFTSFSIFFSFHHTAVAESMWMFSRFIAKSIPVHGSHSVTPNRKMRVHQQGPFPPPPAATSRFTSKPTLRKHFFPIQPEKKVKTEAMNVHCAVTTLVWFDGLHL